MQCECCHWDRKKTPAIKDATPADGLSRCLGDERRYRHIPFSRQLLVGRAVRRYLYQERGASERSSWLVGVPILVRVTATGHLMGVGGLHIRDFIIQERYVLEASRVISLRRVRALRLLIRLEIEPVA